MIDKSIVDSGFYRQINFKSGIEIEHDSDIVSV